MPDVAAWVSLARVVPAGAKPGQFRNQYDNDVTTWSPQGRIHQIEYAMEAVKQGSAVVGIKSKTHVVLLALKRSTSEFASYQPKVFKIDHHLGIGIAGLASDGRLLSNFMRVECLKERFTYNRAMPVQRMATAVADKAQWNTQRYGGRPFGVGLLVAGYDSTGPHLFECGPSGNYYDYVAMSIGARSQSAKTYLEKHLASFESATAEELVKHGLLALRDTLQTDMELTAKNCSVSIVGENQPFMAVTEDDLPRYLAQLEGVRRSTGAPPAAASVAPAATPAPSEAMATDAPPAGAADEPPQRSDMDL